MLSGTLGRPSFRRRSDAPLHRAKVRRVMKAIPNDLSLTSLDNSVNKPVTALYGTSKPLISFDVRHTAH